MAEISISRRLVATKGDDIYPFALDFASWIAISAKATNVTLRPQEGAIPHESVAMECLANTGTLIVPIAGLLGLLLENKTPNAIVFALSDDPEAGQLSIAEPPPGIENVDVKVTVMASLFTNLVCGTFAIFAELYLEKMKAKCQVSDWPPVLKFARMVRHAIVHGGTLNLPNNSPHEAGWCGVHWSAKDRGRQIIGIGNDLSIADLLILMFDLHNEMVSHKVRRT